MPPLLFPQLLLDALQSHALNSVVRKERQKQREMERDGGWRKMKEGEGRVSKVTSSVKTTKNLVRV